MKTSLEEWLTPDGDAADNVQTSTRGKVETAKVAETTDDINEAFGALFNS